MTQHEETPTFDIQSDGVTVWVHSPGYTVARFGLMGIDIHSPDSAACLHCTHQKTTSEDWETFKAKMLEHYSLVVGDDRKPTRFN